MNNRIVALVVIAAGIIGAILGYGFHHDRESVIVGGPGGGSYIGGKVIINVPQGTKVIETTIGCPGSQGIQGGPALTDYQP